MPLQFQCQPTLTQPAPLWSNFLQSVLTLEDYIYSPIWMVMEKQPWVLCCLNRLYTTCALLGSFVCRVKHLQFCRQLPLILKFWKLKENHEQPNSLLISSILLWRMCRAVNCLFWFYLSSLSLQNASGASEYEHQKWWSTGCLCNAPPDSVADSLQSPMWNSAFNFAGISLHLAWPGITSGMLISAASAWMEAFLRVFFELHRGPQGFQSCKNTCYNGVQLPGSRSFFKRAFEMIAISRYTRSGALTVHSDLCEEIYVCINKGICRNTALHINEYVFFFLKNKWSLLTADHISGPIKHDGFLLNFLF